MTLTLTIAAAVLCLVTLLPVTRYTHWLVRDLDFPRLQLVFISCALLLLHFTFLDTQQASSHFLIGATLACLAWQLWWILPYTKLWPKEVLKTTKGDTQNQFSIITSNVLTPNKNAQALIDLVHVYQPDILLTLESDQWWEDQLTPLETNMPYCVKCPLDNLYGMHVYSRLPIENEEICFLVEDDVPSIHGTLTLRSGEKIRVHFLHPAPPSPTENKESAERDAELLVVAKKINKSEQPIIVTGDLNDVAWSTTTRLFRKISGLLDPRIGRGMFNTFHADYPLIRWPLDHLFHSHHFTLNRIERLPSIGSDHFPLYSQLVFAADKNSEQSGLDCNQNDQDLAQEIIDEKEVATTDVPNPEGAKNI